MLVMLLLSVYPHRAGLKNMPGHGGNRTQKISYYKITLISKELDSFPKYHILEPT
jgi:hypothetical protein